MYGELVSTGLGRPRTCSVVTQCLWLVCSVQCLWPWKLHRAIVSDWWYTQQTPWKFLGLLPWTDAEGWAGKKGGEGGASKCSCLDRTEYCVKSSVHVPEIKALFCPLLKGITFSPLQCHSLFCMVIIWLWRSHKPLPRLCCCRQQPFTIWYWRRDNYRLEHGSPLTAPKGNCPPHGKEELGLFACIFHSSLNFSPQLSGGTVHLLV